jgi:hypothetical protein
LKPARADPDCPAAERAGEAEDEQARKFHGVFIGEPDCRLEPMTNLFALGLRQAGFP